MTDRALTFTTAVGVVVRVHDGTADGRTDAHVALAAGLTDVNVHIGKAGRKRHMGVRPTVRGSVMNPNDHPHGGGEGKSPVGHPGPMTPWGKPAMGYKTRSKKNPTNKFIVKRRNDK